MIYNQVCPKDIVDLKAIGFNPCAMSMPSLASLSKEWDAAEAVREQVRSHRCLLTWQGADKKVNMKNAALNYSVIKPLAKCLKDSNNEVGMHHVPQLERQSLVQCFNDPFCSVVCFLRLKFGSSHWLNPQYVGTIDILCSGSKPCSIS